jgi:hypothetical protein
MQKAIFEGLSLCGRNSFGVVWCPWAVSRLPQGSGRLCSRAGLSPCRVFLGPSGIPCCAFWSESGVPAPVQVGLF